MGNDYCNIALIGLHYSSTAETPTEGGGPTTAITIVVVLGIILVAVVMAIILVAVHCRKARVQEVHDITSSAHVCEVFVL